MKLRKLATALVLWLGAGIAFAQYSANGSPTLACGPTNTPNTANASWVDSTDNYLWLCQYNFNTAAWGWVTNSVSQGLVGQTAGTAAAAGFVGEIKASLIASGSAVSLTTVTPANVTSITLTPGDWDVAATVNFVGGSSTIAAGALHEIGLDTTTATLPTTGVEVFVNPPALTTTSAKFGAAISKQTFTVSTNTTVYLVAEGTFTAGTEAVYGSLVARRVR